MCLGINCSSKLLNLKKIIFSIIIMPSLTPMYGLGSYARTGVATVISSPRNRIGSQGRIYTYYKNRGLGQAYEQYLIDALGIKYLPKVNPWTYI
jgi:hypothetical protein